MTFNLMDSERERKALLNLLTTLKDHNYEFVTLTPSSHARILNRQKFPESADRFKAIFGWNLPFDREQLDHALFDALQDAQLVYPKGEQWLSRVRVASVDHRLFIHSSFPTIDTDSVFLGPDTYRFVYHLRQYLKDYLGLPDRILELCCGASPALISIAALFPEQAQKIMVDINPQALFYSEINAEFAGIKNIYAVNSNLFAHLEGNFDLIIANPPYLMDVKQRQYRHGGNALDGAELAFNIIQAALMRLSAKGRLFLYTGVAIHQQGNRFFQALTELMGKSSGYQLSYEEIDPDVFGEELDTEPYQQIERIALVLVKINRM